MAMKCSVSALVVKVDRLIVDVGKQGEKIDKVQRQISFVRGALWVIGGLFAIAIAAIGIYARIKGAR